MMSDPTGRDLPTDFDPELAFAAVANILATMRVSYGLSRLGIAATNYGPGFLAEIWWERSEGVIEGSASGQGKDANEALKAALRNAANDARRRR